MTDDDLATAYIEEVLRVAPDLARDDIAPRAHLQDDLDLDSMDVLNLVAALHARLGVDIPEADYPQIATRERAVAYLGLRLRPGG